MSYVDSFGRVAQISNTELVEIINLDEVAAAGAPVGSIKYLIGDVSTDGSVRTYVDSSGETISVVFEILVTGTWQEVGRFIPSTGE